MEIFIPWAEKYLGLDNKEFTKKFKNLCLAKIEPALQEKGIETHYAKYFWPVLYFCKSPRYNTKPKTLSEKYKYYFPILESYGEVKSYKELLIEKYDEDKIVNYILNFLKEKGE